MSLLALKKDLVLPLSPWPFAVGSNDTALIPSSLREGRTLGKGSFRVSVLLCLAYIINWQLFSGVGDVYCVLQNAGQLNGVALYSEYSHCVGIFVLTRCREEIKMIPG